MSFVKQKQASSTFVKQDVSGGLLQTIWDGGDATWDAPSPFTIWDKDLTEGFVRQKQSSTTYIKQKQVS